MYIHKSEVENIVKDLRINRSNEEYNITKRQAQIIIRWNFIFDVVSLYIARHQQVLLKKKKK